MEGNRRTPSPPTLEPQVVPPTLFTYKVAKRSETPSASQINTNTTSMPQATVDVIATFTRALQEALRHPSTEAKIPLPQFAGLEQEDPHIFLEKIEEHFRREGILEYEEQTRVAAKQLRGEAQRWYAPYSQYPIGYEEFRNKLLNRYDDTSTQALLRTKLYGERQKETEAVSMFILRKRTLFSRLQPHTSEVDMIAVIVELLHGSIRTYLRTQAYHNLEDFTRIAERIEADLNEQRRAVKKLPIHTQNPTFNMSRQEESSQTIPRQATVADRKPSLPNSTWTATNTSRPPTPCRFCREWHYHNECPQNPYLKRENWRGAGPVTPGNPAQAQQTSQAAQVPQPFRQ